MIDNTGLVFVQEPEIKVGVIEGVRELEGRFNGPFRLDDGRMFTGPFSVRTSEGSVIFADQQGARIDRKQELCFSPEQGATFSLTDVTIGIRFHWERKQEQTFQGDLRLSAAGGTLTAVNRLHLEDYLASVVSSEMSATAPLEMLKAHAVASRSWLMAMLMRRGKTVDPGADRREASEQTGEIVRWYGREDHTRFDVCADDHCQRYQGITKRAGFFSSMPMQSVMPAITRPAAAGRTILKTPGKKSLFHIFPRLSMRIFPMNPSIRKQPRKSGCEPGRTPIATPPTNRFCAASFPTSIRKRQIFSGGG
jgi:hypothetical protein